MSICLKCNKPIDPSAAFCPHCGEDFAEKRSHSGGPASPDAPRSRRPGQEKFSVCMSIGSIAALLGAILRLIALSVADCSAASLQVAAGLADIGHYVMIFGLLVLLLSLHVWLKSDT